MMKMVCTICGGTEFVPAYNGRLGFNGQPPCCKSCGSVERHRIVRGIYNHLVPITEKLDCLHFAPDIAVSPDNFKSYESSIYGGQNSMDMKDTKLPDNSFDIIVSNHVFEHVDDDIAALKECLRLVGEDGIVHICVPSPAECVTTRDWGFADETKTYHYRHYGADLGINFCRAVPGLHGIGIAGKDEVSGANDLIFMFSHSRATLDGLLESLLRTEYIGVFIG